MGSTADPRRIVDAGHRRGGINREPVPGPAPPPALPGLEDLPAQSAVGIASLDLFVVRTISFKLLHGLLRGHCIHGPLAQIQ